MASYLCWSVSQAEFAPKLRKAVNPDRCLRLAAALEHEPAVAELSRRASRKGQRGQGDTGGEPRERFTREHLNKARSWTEKDERAEEYLDKLMGG